MKRRSCSSAPARKSRRGARPSPPRERLVSQRERELDDREDGKGSWDGTGLSEMEARLRRLEQQQPGEQTLGFAGGLRKLEQGTRNPRER